MDDFDLKLEWELRRMLAPVVAAPAPVWRRPIEIRRTDYALGPGEYMPEAQVFTLGPHSQG